MSRPRKVRPAFGADLSQCVGLRDVEAATGVDRKFLAKAMLVASIPEIEFEAMVESENPPTVSELANLARRRAGKKTDYVRRCPHCHMSVKIEDVRS